MKVGGRRAVLAGALALIAGGAAVVTAATRTAVRPPSLGRFRPVEGLPASCQVLASSEPAAVAPLAWRACAGGGAPGCRELIVNWEPADPAHPLFADLAGGRTPGGPVLVVSRRPGRLTDGRAETVVSYADGPVLAAVRAPAPASDRARPCLLVSPAVTAGRVVLGASDFATAPGVSEHEIEVALDGGRVRAQGTLSAALLRGSVAQLRSAGQDLVALSLQPRSAIITVAADGSPARELPRPPGQAGARVDQPLVVGGDVLYRAVVDGRAREWIYHVASGRTEPLLDVPGADVIGVRADGGVLVWIESSPSRASLFMSPYASTPRLLAARKVANLAPELANPHVFFQSGRVVLRDRSWRRDLIVDLQGGCYRVLEAPAGAFWGEVLYLDGDEIALPVAPAWNPSQTFTIRRQELGGLSAARPLPGPGGTLL
jgi:hypothetical protein